MQAIDGVDAEDTIRNKSYSRTMNHLDSWHIVGMGTPPCVMVHTVAKPARTLRWSALLNWDLP